MRRIGDEELPLQICLGWTDDGIDSLGRNQFVLQDYDTGEILVRQCILLFVIRRSCLPVMKFVMRAFIIVACGSAVEDQKTSLTSLA